MSINRTICDVKQVDYNSIRKAMVEGARKAEEIKEKTGACLECEGCRENMDGILKSVCGCRGVSLDAVAEAVKNGADTVEKVGEVTGAGTACGRCKPLIQNVIDQGR